MNIYMFFKLRTAVRNNIINIGTSNEHIDSMIKKDWLEPDVYQSTRFNDDPIPLLLGTAKITEEGKEQYLKVRNEWFKYIVTIVIAIAGVCGTLAGVL
ncbi:hypothetical protein UF72_0675 [Staphylococcus equorum subsp. equorum]|uniref:Uncharacterized protein n=1 Tax=Staphylococcus equorum TaxID=246432 RepID=A0AAW7ALA6_9STAP|nr:hypothetical protein [Staphylococcus equorum]KKI55449.1 hypothetical protein UF72_0675 [Staphylococcus equorum subsp. equorum]MDK9866794.1 hypothetical protein [Staphylococcus equorum]